MHNAKQLHMRCVQRGIHVRKKRNAHSIEKGKYFNIKRTHYAFASICIKKTLHPA